MSSRFSKRCKVETEPVNEARGQTSTTCSEPEELDARVEMGLIIDDLRTQLRTAERRAERYKRAYLELKRAERIRLEGTSDGAVISTPDKI